METARIVLLAALLVAAATAASGQTFVGPSTYPHTTDGEWTDWTPGAPYPWEWYDIPFFKGRYSYYSADYLSTTATMYVMNDFFINTTGIPPEDYNEFFVWVPRATAEDRYTIRVYGDNHVEAWLNGEPVGDVQGAFQFIISPMDDEPHTVYEIAIPAPAGANVTMAANDPNEYGSPQRSGAFVGTFTTGPRPTLHQIDVPVCFSVDGGLTNPWRGTVGPPANPAEGINTVQRFPNDVFSLGVDGHGFATEAEIFQASGLFGRLPDMTNALRMSGAQAFPVGPHAAPPVGPPISTPPAPLGLMLDDNINALSFGMDGGDILHFSVDPQALGQSGTAVENQAQMAPPGWVMAPFPSSGGGDPGDEAAGDLFVTAPISWFGTWFTFMPTAGVTPHSLEADEVLLGLQAPAATGTMAGPEEDDLDALEMTDAVWVDAMPQDGLPDPESAVYFSLDTWSPTVQAGMAQACDILVTNGPVNSYALFADGIIDIGLLLGDDIDALVLSDTARPPGTLEPGSDMALFSLAPGSPSLAGADGAFGTGDDLSPGDVFYTDFLRPWAPTVGYMFGGSLYATASRIGLRSDDNLNALDISCRWLTFQTYELVEWEGPVDEVVAEVYIRDQFDLRYQNTLDFPEVSVEAPLEGITVIDWFGPEFAPGEWWQVGFTNADRGPIEGVSLMSFYQGLPVGEYTPPLVRWTRTGEDPILTVTNVNDFDTVWIEVAGKTAYATYADFETLDGDSPFWYDAEWLTPDPVMLPLGEFAEFPFTYDWDATAHAALILVYEDAGGMPGELTMRLPTSVTEMDFRTPPVLGDLNCDGLTNNYDIDAFVLALTGPPEFYHEEFPDCDIMAGDMNGDGALTWADIDGFVEAIVVEVSLDPHFGIPAGPAPGDLRLIMSTSDVAPDERENPELAAPGTLYIWAQVIEGQVWNGVGLGLVTYGDATATAQLYNPFIPAGGDYRWSEVSDLMLDPSGNAVSVVGGLGLGTEWETIVDGFILMGEVNVGLLPDGVAGNVFIQIGWHGITYIGGPEGSATVSFGIGDPALIDNNVGGISGIPDASVGTWVPGDMDCDGSVDFDDIDPFVAALSGPLSYYQDYPHCRWMNADANGDGYVNFDDIDPFVGLIGS